MSKKRLFVSALVSVVLAMPVTGFVFGFVVAPLSFSQRAWVGAWYAFATTLSFGFPSAPEDYAPSDNLWPYIIVCALVIFGICTVFIHYRCKPESRT
jgi:hypothetical protein